MKEILLSRGMVALVDDEDYERLSKHKWCVRKCGNMFYAGRRVNGYISYMHREILGLSPGDGNLIDHRNQSGLDNQKTNLRLADKSINGINGKLKKRNTSGYRGVDWLKYNKKWRARIVVNCVEIHCGCYSTPEDAAHAYDEMAIKYRGSNAILNFP